MVKTALALLLAASVCAQKADCAPKAEKPYEFRARLDTVHEPDLRDRALKPGADDFAFTDGMRVSIPASSGEVLYTAARDFTDYLWTSMGVNATLERTAQGSAGLTVALDGTLAARQSKISVTAAGVSLRAKDEREAAQALYHLEDLMNLRRAPFLRIGEETRTRIFSPRMTHSGWGIDMFPDAHLSRIAHYGFDAILVFERCVDRNAKGDIVDINDIIRRAKRFGLDTYIYNYVNVTMHPSDPEAEEHYDKAFGTIAAAHPEAKGIVFVGESAQFPSKDERSNGLVHPQKPKPGDNRRYSGWYPCRDYPEWLAAVRKALHRYSPGMETVFWTYNWYSVEEGPRLELINSLPTDTSLLVTWEMGTKCPPNRMGLNTRVWDYSLSFVGPSEYFTSEAECAHKRGLKLYTMSNTGGETWDMGCAPYLPCPDRWKTRWDRLRKANADWGLSGLMESHHFGWWPGFVSELSKEAFTEGGMPYENHIRAIAARDYGPQAVDRAREAWKLMSEAMADSLPVPHNLMTTYRIGPAYPFNFYGKRINRSSSSWTNSATSGRQPGDFPCELTSWLADCIVNPNYLDDMATNDGRPAVFDLDDLRTEIVLLTDMVAKTSRAADLFDDIAAGAPSKRTKANARGMAALLRYFDCAYTTTRNLKRAVLAIKTKGDTAAKDEVFAIAREEHANKKRALAVVDADSRLGWEPSQEYIGGRRQIEWCLERMKQLYKLSD